jgi:predicted ATPase/class 3 adenylate cyclase
VSTRQLPSGTLTFLFTDLEGSTRLLHELGNRYGELLEMHRRLIRAAVTAHDGIEFGTGGDAVFSVFESCTGAVAAAEAAQRSLSEFPWPDDARIRVRMALHTGEARIVDDDYVGVALHVAARLCSAGHGGQVLLSDSTRGLVRHASVLSLGTHRLRDVPEPMEIFQLTGPGLEQDFPAVRTLSGLPNNLPVPRDRVFGRELDIADVEWALGTHRLVTLVGPGGAGKTRLALEVAVATLGTFRDGAWFVPLAAATTPDQVATLVAKELHVADRGAESLITTLHARLAASEILLVIDNCEHLIDAVAEFVDVLLAVSTRVRVLATSREPLGIAGELARRVAPLPVGDANTPGAATALFIERASTSAPDFDPGPSDVTLIAEVCTRLDGLPLAIELAAARIRSMSLRQLADRLGDRFHLLTRGPRTADARQRTLEAVVSWSYELLDEADRAGFRRLALFPDSFTIAAAEEVAGWGAIAQSEMIDVISRLVDKSLIVPLKGGDEYRYGLLETLRQYGREQLQVAGEQDQAVQHLKRWARGWVDRLEQDMRTPRQDASLAATAWERENLQAVYELANTTEDLELRLRIVTFAPTMPLRERRTAIEELLAQEWEAPSALKGHALTSYAQFSSGAGMSQAAALAAEEAALIFEQLGDRRHAAWARYFEIFSAWGLQPDEAIRAQATNLISEFRALDDGLGLAWVLWAASQLDVDAERADAHAAEAETLFRRLDSPVGLAHTLEGRALICMPRQNDVAAATYLVEALDLLENSDHPGCTAHTLDAAALLLAGLGQSGDAQRLLHAAEELRRVSGEGSRPWELRSRASAERLVGECAAALATTTPTELLHLVIKGREGATT